MKTTGIRRALRCFCFELAEVGRARLLKTVQHIAAEIDAFPDLAGQALRHSIVGLSYMTSKIAVP